MFEGLLWFDKSAKRTRQEKLDLAAARFRERLRKVANRCYVHPGEEFEHPSIAIRPDPSVMPGYLWVGHGVDDA